MSHATLLSLLLPPASYSPLQARLAAELGAEGAALDCANASADQIANAVTPGAIPGLLPDWERVLGLPNVAALSDADRVRRIAAKLAETGGLSIPYFIRLAAAMGMAIQITEPRPAAVGDLHAGDLLYGDEVRHIWLWRPASGSWQIEYDYWFAEAGKCHAGSPLQQRLETLTGSGLSVAEAGLAQAGERLIDMGDHWLDALFDDLKPAWTLVSAWLPGGEQPPRPVQVRNEDFLTAGDSYTGDALSTPFDGWRLPNGQWLTAPPLTTH